MWWILGISILIIALAVLLSWPFSMNFAINTDAYGRNWVMTTKIPFRTFKGSYQDGKFDISDHFIGLDRLFIVYFRDLFGKLIYASFKKTKASPSKKADFWDNVVLRSLRIQKISVEMGVKGTVSGEATFLFGILIALLYPAFGFIYYNNKGFVPEISFKKDLAGFALTCIITFSLGQVIHEAGKRYWALWKESKYAR
ncbi:MAG: hypothetical protein PHD88_01750 [Firmicutes bacterium]|nr:hypothetical protein [Bacillota bacterium]MDD4693118.1 hypothetical protein [Bacillota bacterium]